MCRHYSYIYIYIHVFAVTIISAYMIRIWVFFRCIKDFGNFGRLVLLPKLQNFSGIWGCDFWGWKCRVSKKHPRYVI